ncbi:uncharacterized protein LOC115322747 [Ixodes scapularis]|uniref:uncharacterized protein LOC115322747 n=1 Tax=Ixodes scapularis TaxID=6945 RepID=UPI001A9DC70F|nr:uncharacterized protein LOC115322747 [Ixodes scapularis]
MLNWAKMVRSLLMTTRAASVRRLFTTGYFEWSSMRTIAYLPSRNGPAKSRDNSVQGHSGSLDAGSGSRWRSGVAAWQAIQPFRTLFTILSTPMNQTLLRSSCFVLVNPWCPLCARWTALCCRLVGITIRGPRRISPSLDRLSSLITRENGRRSSSILAFLSSCGGSCKALVTLVGRGSALVSFKTFSKVMAHGKLCCIMQAT